MSCTCQKCNFATIGQQPLSGSDLNGVDSKKITVTWIGKAVSKNNRIGVRAIKAGSKWRGMVYEKAEYKNFKKEISRLFPPGNTFNGYVDIEIFVSLWKMRDTGNCLEPVMDGIEASGIIKNDRNIRHVKINREYHKRDEYDSIKIVLTEVKEDGKKELL